MFDFSPLCLSICFLKALKPCMYTHTGCNSLTFSARRLDSESVCLFAQLEEVATPCQPHTQRLTQKILPQPGYQLISDILDKSKESSYQNEVFISSSSYRPPWTQPGQLVLSPSGWNKVQICRWGPDHTFSGREERTRSLGRDTRRRAMSQARGSTRWLLLSFMENISF